MYGSFPRTRVVELGRIGAVKYIEYGLVHVVHESESHLCKIVSDNGQKT